MKGRRRALGWLSLASLQAGLVPSLLGCSSDGNDMATTTASEEPRAQDDPGADETGDPTSREGTGSPAGGGVLPATLALPTPLSPVASPLELRVTALNATGEPRELLLWNTPFESIVSADLFDVVREEDGVHLGYTGRLVKRALPPPADAIVTLAPGERLDAVVDLARLYPLERPGRYTVRLDPLGVPVTIDGRPLADLSAADPEPIAFERY